MSTPNDLRSVLTVISENLGLDSTDLEDLQSAINGTCDNLYTYFEGAVSNLTIAVPSFGHQ